MLLSVLRFITTHPLTAGNRIGALSAFARWQLASRLWPGDFIHEWVNGARVRVRHGQTGFTGNIYTGLHEFPDMAFLLHYLRPEDLFVDVGANVGSYTVLACAAVGAECVAIEPVPNTFARGVEKVSLNGREQDTRCLRVGIGAQRGSLRFTSDGDTENHVLAPGEVSQKVVEVSVQTLDDVLEGAKPRLLKIDVEGYETSVIAGAGGTLGGSDPMAVIMELNESGNHYGFSEHEIMRNMLEMRFLPHAYDPFSRTLRPLSDKNTTGGNTIFVRDTQFAVERTRSAPAFVVHGRRI